MIYIIGRSIEGLPCGEAKAQKLISLNSWFPLKFVSILGIGDWRLKEDQLNACISSWNVHISKDPW